MRRFPRWAAGCCCALLLGPVGSSWSGTPDPAELASHDWIEVRTPHLTITSDARESVALPQARRLEQLGEMLRVLYPGLRGFPTLPIDVYLFRDDAGLAVFTPASTESVSGFALEGPGRCVFVMGDPGRGAEREHVSAHEFTHLFIRANFREMPIWLNEGLAQYFQTTRIRGAKVEFGHKIDWLISELSGIQWNDLDLLFAMNTASKAYQRDNDLRTSVYAQGWAMTHYLQAAPDRATRFDSILVALRRGLTPRNAFRTQYPPDQWPGIVSGTQKYIKDAMLQHRTVALPAAAADLEPTPRALGSAEALRRLGDLALAMGKDARGSATALYESALAADSTLARARVALGYLADVAADSAKADLCYAGALRRSPSDARVHLLIGLGLIARVFEMDLESNSKEAEAVAVEVVARARRHLETCLQAEPDNPEAMAALVHTRLMQGEEAGELEPMLARAADMLPARKPLHDLLARLRKQQPEGASGAGEGR